MAREARQDALGRAPLAQAVKDPAPVGAEDVGQHPAQAQSLIVKRLLQALPHPGAVGDDLAPVPALLAQRAEGRRRHVAGPRQAVLADARQPQAVGHVRLAPADLLDVLGMHQVRADAGCFESPERHLPVDARGFHRGRGHAVPAQPRDECAEALPVRAKDSRGPARRAQAHAGRDLILVDVEACGVRLGHRQAVDRRGRRRGRVWHVLASLAGGSGEAFPARCNGLATVLDLLSA